MKKFNWKALLIAVLVLVLAVALVACGDKGGTKPGGTTPGGTTPGGTTPGGTTPGGTPTDYTAGEFFTELWDMTNDIGDEEIAAGNNVYVKADLELELGTKRENYTVNESTKLGLKLEGVLDRSATSNADNDTVIKLQLYSGEVNICTLSLLAKDDKNLYIDFGGQKIKLPLEVVVGDEDFNSMLTQGLNWVLTHNFAKPDEKEFTINGVINSLSGDMGADWSLDNLINGVLALTPFSPDYIVDLLSNNELLKGFAEYIVVEDPETGAKSISLIQALSSPIISGVFNAAKNGNHYTAKLGDSIAAMLAGMIGEAGTDYLELQLSYDKTADNKLADGLTITADLFSEAGDSLYKGDDEIHPFLSVKIKDLEFGDATANPTAHTVTVPTTQYSTEVAVALSEKLSFAGVKLNGEALKDIELSFKASLDLENESNNKTKAEAYLSYGTAKLLHATYVNGRLAVTIDRSEEAKVAGYPVIDMLVSAFGDSAYNWLKDTFFNKDENNTALKQFENAFFIDTTHKAVKADFKGAAWTGIDIKGLYDFGIEKLVELIKSKIPGAAASAAEEGKAKFDPTGILPTVYEAFRYVAKLEDGKIQIKSDDVLQTVVDLVNTFNHVGPSDKTAWSKDGCYDEIENMIVNTVAGAMYKVKDHTTLTDEQKTGARTEIEKQLQEVLTGENEAYAHVEITGLGTKPANKTYLRFVIESVMSELKADVTIDFTAGLGLKVQAGFAGATVTSETKLGMFAAKDLVVTDLAAGITQSGNGWTVWDLSDFFESLNTPANA